MEVAADQEHVWCVKSLLHFSLPADCDHALNIVRCVHLQGDIRTIISCSITTTIFNIIISTSNIYAGTIFFFFNTSNIYVGIISIIFIIFINTSNIYVGIIIVIFISMYPASSSSPSSSSIISSSMWASSSS